MRGTKPALADRRMRIDGALKYHFLQIRRKHAQDDENVGVRGRRRHIQFDGGWSGDLRFTFKRRGQKGDTATHGFKAQYRFFVRGFIRAKSSRWIEIKLGPLRALERP